MKNLLFVVSMSLTIILVNRESACKKIVNQSQGNRILILGNSITYKVPAPQLGWNGSWGMAASSPEKDYVHILTRKIKSKDSYATVVAGSVGTFERNFWKPLDTAYLAKYKAGNPNIIILKIGENTPDSLAVKDSLGKNLVKLIKYLSPNDKTKVCLSGCFWPKHNVDRIIEETCRENNWTFVSNAGLYNDATNASHERFADKGVGNHPSDKGMNAIAIRIWSKIESFFL